MLNASLLESLPLPISPSASVDLPVAAPGFSESVRGQIAVAGLFVRGQQVLEASGHPAIVVGFHSDGSLVLTLEGGNGDQFPADPNLILDLNPFVIWEAKERAG